MSIRRPRLLIVEDEILLAWLARETLGREGCEIVVASGRTDAVAAALADRPDLVIMDVDLAFDPARPGDWDGVAAACAIYDKTGIRCLLVGSLDPHRQLRAAAARPLGMLAKPYKGSELAAAVRSALASAVRRAPAIAARADQGAARRDA